VKKKGKEKCENIDKKMKVYIIITMVKAIWVVLIVHQSILQIIEKIRRRVGRDKFARFLEDEKLLAFDNVNARRWKVVFILVNIFFIFGRWKV